MERRFLISDAEHRPIAIAHLESPADEKPFNLLIQTYEPGMPSTALSIQQKITLIDIDNDLAMEGTIVNHAADRLLVEPGKRLGAEARKNLRVRTAFESIMFPVSGGSWQGQHKFISHDLSSGGIALRSNLSLECGETIELVLPVMEPPLLVKASVLRPLPSNYPEQLYATKFVDLTDDEDSLIRKSVFSIQLHPH